MTAWITSVFLTVAMTLTFAESPRLVESVIVIVLVPVPDMVLATLTISPTDALPLPAIKTDRV